jgi:hypothetical protein
MERIHCASEIILDIRRCNNNDELESTYYPLTSIPAWCRLFFCLIADKPLSTIFIGRRRREEEAQYSFTIYCTLDCAACCAVLRQTGGHHFLFVLTKLLNIFFTRGATVGTTPNSRRAVKTCSWAASTKKRQDEKTSEDFILRDHVQRSV